MTKGTRGPEGPATVMVTKGTRGPAMTKGTGGISLLIGTRGDQRDRRWLR